MSKIAFIHDSRFLQHNNKVFADSQFSSDLWRRYLRTFKAIVVIGRDGSGMIDQATVTRSDCPNVDFILAPNLSAFRGYFASRKRLKDTLESALCDVDGVVVRVPSVLGIAAANFARRHKIPVFVEVVGCAFDAYWNHGSLLAKFFAPISFLRTRAVVAKADQVLYVTKKYLQARYPAQVTRSTACSDVYIEHSLFENPKKNYVVDDEFVFGLIGSLKTRHKGIQTIFGALALLKPDFPKIKFRILGGGDTAVWQAEATAMGVEKMVFFDGTRSGGKQVLDWIDALDCYLQPSLTEGLPRSLIEAMSRGLPAIATNVGGIPELLDADCLIEPEDVSGLASHMRISIKDEFWRIQKGAANYERSLEYNNVQLDFTRQAFLERFQKLISPAL